MTAIFLWKKELSATRERLMNTVDKIFSATGPQFWNSLLQEIKAPQILQTYRLQNDMNTSLLQLKDSLKNNAPPPSPHPNYNKKWGEIPDF